MLMTHSEETRARLYLHTNFHILRA